MTAKTTDRAAPTRGDFVRRVALAGGSAYGAMLGLGLIADARPAPFEVRGRGDGIDVVILGAGVAGLCAAYELGKLGYRCTILEARTRPGGRVWTVRDGTTLTELSGVTQTAAFGTAGYMNAGAARVPQHHVTIDYYRELGIAIEPFIFTNTNAWYYDAAGKRRLRGREARMDLRGEVDELLAKAVRRDAVDEPMTKADRDRLIAFLEADGKLDKDLVYRGSDRAGFVRAPDVAPGTFPKPIDLETLVRAGFGMPQIQDAEIDWQPAIYQPVGGMDALPTALAKRLPGVIRYGAHVRELLQTPGGGARVVYRDASGATRTIDADVCICTLPLTVLRGIPAAFSAPFARAIRAIDYGSSTKVAFAAKRRFWEEDDRILGGISWTDTPMTQILYPSTGYLSKTGVIVGAYNFGKNADAYGKLHPADRIAKARAEGQAIHPQYATELTSGFTVAWQNVAENRGAWVEWTQAQRAHEYNILEAFEGPYVLAGEHMSYINAWQAGALESARSVVAKIGVRMNRAT